MTQSDFSAMQLDKMIADGVTLPPIKLSVSQKIKLRLTVWFYRSYKHMPAKH